MAALNWRSLVCLLWNLLLVEHSSSFPVVADMQPQTLCFYVAVSTAIFLCFLDTSTTLAPQTVSPRWSRLKGATKSSSALSGELKKERRWESFLCVLPVCAVLQMLIVPPTPTASSCVSTTSLTLRRIRTRSVATAELPSAESGSTEGGRKLMKTTNLNTFLAIVCRCYDLCTEPRGFTLKLILWMSRKAWTLAERGMGIPVFTKMNVVGWRRGTQ